MKLSSLFTCLLSFLSKTKIQMHKIFFLFSSFRLLQQGENFLSPQTSLSQGVILLIFFTERTRWVMDRQFMWDCLSVGGCLSQSTQQEMFSSVPNQVQGDRLQVNHSGDKKEGVGASVSGLSAGSHHWESSQERVDSSSQLSIALCGQSYLQHKRVGIS